MKPFYLDGVPVTTPVHQSVFNPWSGEKLDDVCMAEAGDVSSAIAAAHRAFTVTRRVTALTRSKALEKIGSVIAARSAEFTDLISAETGKPVTMAVAEVQRAIQTFHFAAAHALADEGHGIAMDASPTGVGHFGFVRRFPIGVILGITPFNFPLNLLAHKIAPCIATGNTMLLKPSPKAPLTALLLGEVLSEAGLPAGQINILPFHQSLIDPMLDDPRVAMLSFTGGVDVGWHLKAKAARLKVSLELGGNAAVVVEPDCDWLSAIPLIAAASFGFAGQSCISVQRILVHREILPAFRDALVAHTLENIRTGDPAEPATLVGPMIDSEARDRILAWITEATSRGATLLTPLRIEGRSLLFPVLLEGVPPGCSILEAEAFAPVAVLQPYDAFDEAIALVNSSRFGLQAGVFTNDLSKALLAHEEIEAGGVMINQVPTFRVENMPYGGIKQSGTGREGIPHAMAEMTEPKSLVIRHN